MRMLNHAAPSVITSLNHTSNSCAWASLNTHETDASVGTEVYLRRWRVRPDVMVERCRELTGVNPCPGRWGIGRYSWG